MKVRKFQGKCSICRLPVLLTVSGLVGNHGGHFGFFCSGSGSIPVQGSISSLKR